MTSQKKNKNNSSQKQSNGRKWPASVYYFIIVIFSFILYGNTISNKYSFDDNLVIHDNDQVHQGIKGIPDIFTSHYKESDRNTYGYRPMAKATFAIEYQLWKESPGISHFINILLYAFCGILLLLVLKKIFQHYNPTFLFLIIVLFLAHPVHTEAVASLKNREELLCFIGSFLSLLFFIKYYQSNRLVYLVSALLSFIFAVLSKQTAVVFAAIVPLTIFFIDSNLKIPSIQFKQFREFKWHIIFMISFLAGMLLFYPILLISFSCVYFIIREKYGRFNFQNILKNRLIAIGLLLLIVGFFFSLFHLGLAKPVLILAILAPLGIFGIREIAYRKITIFILILAVFALMAYILPGIALKPENKTLYYFENPLFKYSGFEYSVPYGFLTLLHYLKLLVLPYPLLFYYGYNTIPLEGWSSIWVLLSVLFHLFLLIIAFIKLREKHVLSFLILFYIISISIFSNWFLKIPGIIGERLLFLPSVAFSIFTVWLIFKILKIDFAKDYIPSSSKRKVVLLSAVIVIVYGFKTIDRNKDWKNLKTLYEADISKLSNSAKANSVYADYLTRIIFDEQNKSGSVITNKENIEKALMYYQKTIDIYPDFPSAHNNIGTIYYNLMGRYDKAVQSFIMAVKIDSLSKEAYFNLASSYDKNGDTLLALKSYNKAYIMDTANIYLLSQWANLLYYYKKDLDSAIILNKKIARVNPDIDLPYINIGNYYLSMHDTVNTISWWEKALKISPENKNLEQIIKQYNKRKKIR
jgi:tetratricopeptide (TPR) repeat protein